MESRLPATATIILTLCAAGLALLAGSTAAAQQTGQTSGPTASAVGDGLRLTLTLPRATYPRNALAQATVEVDNLTDRSVLYAGEETEGGCPPPAYLYPIVRAVGADGTAYPPALPPGLPMGVCLPGFYAYYRPNERRTYTIPVVLVASQVRVTLLALNPDETETMPLEAEVGVKLTVGMAPTISIRPKGSNLVATVRSHQRVDGPLYFMDRVSCGSGLDDSLIRYHNAWTPHRGTTLRSGSYFPCAPPDHWYLMVGWLNHPIAIARYVGHGPHWPLGSP